MRPLNNMEDKALSDIYWRVQLGHMTLQTHSSLETPLEYNQDQSSLKSF